MTRPVTDNQVGWMLDDLLLEVPKTRNAVLITADGLVKAWSQGLARETAEKVAALISPMQSLSSNRELAEFAGGHCSAWQCTLTELDDGHVLIAAAGDGSFVAVSTARDADLFEVTRRVTDLVQRLGENLTSPPRDHQASGRARPTDGHRDEHIAPHQHASGLPMRNPDTR